MTGMSSLDMLKFLRFIVITQGERGAIIRSNEGEHHIPVVPPEKIADPTGVGDAFRGGFITAYCYGLDLKTCGQVGVLAATYCLEQQGPQGHSYSRKEFVDRYRKYFDDQGRLAVLVKSGQAETNHSPA
jgi:adenosine kinase